MKSTVNALMLKYLSIEYYGPLPWMKSFSYFLKTRGENVYFSSSYAEQNEEKTWNFYEIEVPYSVIEDLSQLARSGGAVGSSKWVDPLVGVLDAHKCLYDLEWVDGTHTGPGTAAEQLMSYLNTLGRQCADKLKKAETTTWTCSCGFSKNAGKFCLECGHPRPA